MLGVAEQQTEVVVDGAPLVLAAVVRGVLPTTDRVDEVLDGVRVQGLSDEAVPFRIEAGAGLAGRLRPGVEDFVDDGGVRSTSTSTSTSTSCARAPARTEGGLTEGSVNIP